MSVLSYEDLLSKDGPRADPFVLAELVRALLSDTSSAAEKSRVVKATSGLLFGFTASSSLAGAQFIQLFDASALPSDGAIPAAVFSIAGTSTLTIQYLPPRAFRNGIVICNSTTQNSKTLGAANTLFDVQYL